MDETFNIENHIQIYLYESVIRYMCMGTCIHTHI